MEDFKEVNKALKVKLWEEIKTGVPVPLMLYYLKSWEAISVHCSCQGHAWLKDDEATQCKQCQKEFSIARRKVGSFFIAFYLYYIYTDISSMAMSSPRFVLQHHCRNCGDIYCNSCSSNELALPSYPRPVRVCDMCHSILLQRSSSTASWQNTYKSFLTRHIHYCF